MASKGVRQMVFSSSATVYGEPERLPLTEDHPLRPVNLYAKNKLIIEHILADLKVIRLCITANLCTGRGYSVLEVAKAFERASGKSIPLDFQPRRAGDVAQSFADASFAAKETRLARAPVAR
jgi:UDP-glucose 4-epimerase